MLLFALLVTCTYAAVMNCNSWSTATLTGYDNLDGADDPNAGAIAEFSNVTLSFLTAVPVVAIHSKDWAVGKYRYINIKWNGVTKQAMVWDYCSDLDCPPGCCTTNAQAFGGNYLVDMERRALLKLFNVSSWDTTFSKVTYQLCRAFNPIAVGTPYGLKP